MKKLFVVLLASLLSLAFAASAYADTFTSATTNTNTSKLTRSDAIGIALNDAGFKKSQVVGLETESEKNLIKVEFKKKNKKTEYEYKIAVKDGTILKKEIEYAYKHNCSRAKVGKKAALKKVAKASGIDYSIIKKGKCSYTYKKCKGKYEIVFKYQGYKYEYELLAPTGKITEWEMKLL